MTIKNSMQRGQVARSLYDYTTMYKHAEEDAETFWAREAESFTWKKKWDSVLEWDFSIPTVEWFRGGKLNITENCLDRHLEHAGDQTAILWEPNDPNDPAISLSYKELHKRVCDFAGALRAQGVKKGDRVCIYMPMVPELAIACLACARLGAVHSVVFAGFSATALADRINDADAKLVLTADGSYRGNKVIGLKSIVDEALKTCPGVERTVVLQRTGEEVGMEPDRDIWWEDALKSGAPVLEAEVMDAEDPLFILYTSGSTGKPKGMVHTCGGYMVYTHFSFRNVFQYQAGEVYWCTADIGWITGHSYIVYGPLAAGATTVMFEGVPTWPDAGRFWEVVEKHEVALFYTAPTAIRALEKFGTDWPAKYDLSSLRVLGTVGEPINEEAWDWYHLHIGKGKCPIVDTWWQTETGGIMISPLAGITPVKPTCVTLPLPGIRPVLVTETGEEISGNNAEGQLCIEYPWPSMARTIYGDHARFREVYFSKFPGKYFTGDGCKRDHDGYYRITGRVDDVIIVSGHNLGTAEIEDALDLHEQVCETAVVGFPHPIKGNAIYAFVTCYDQESGGEQLRGELIKVVADVLGPIAKPEKIQFVKGLPKTRSGKIMRRILRKIAAGDTSDLGDISTLLDPSVVAEIIKHAE